MQCKRNERTTHGTVFTSLDLLVEDCLGELLEAWDAGRDFGPERQIGTSVSGSVRRMIELENLRSGEERVSIAGVFVLGRQSLLRGHCAEHGRRGFCCG